MNILKNLKIRDKLLLLLSLLLFPLIYFVVSTISIEIEENEQLKQEAIQLEESERISVLIHAFQKERARMMAAAGGDETYLVEAKTQRQLTDAAENKLKEYLIATDLTLPELSKLDDIRKYRNDLDQNRLDVPQFRQYSTGMIFDLLNRMDANASGIGNVAIGKQLTSFRNLAETKIQLARIRSMLVMAIQEKRFSINTYAQLNSQYAFYNSALGGFTRYADEASLADVQNILASENYKKVVGILQAIEKDPGINMSAYNSRVVFNLFTKSIEDYRVAEMQLINRIKNQVNEEISRKEQHLTFLVIGMMLILGLTGILSIYIINLISASLATLKTAADRIKLGATDVTIDINSKDEIGSVASSFRGVVNKTVSLSRVAQAIGQGRYDVEVAVQSDEDVLSYAIKDMKDNLQTFTTENANRNWVLTGVAELSNLMGGEDSLEKVASLALSYLCNYTDSDAGVLYLHNDAGKLQPVAGYGVQQNKEQLPSFEIGNGKVGQAVKERKVKVLEQVPDEYLRIRTGLSDIEPATVIILPLYFGNTIVGALELASRQSYNEVKRRLLDSAAERISVLIFTLKAHLQTQELLYETQNQAEELETQQEELRQLNAELKASEEELRVNQEELQEKNAELEEKAQLLEEQYEALSSKNKALEDAREAIELKIHQVETVSKYKSDFLANMSHELRTPLNSILILSRLLADNTENTLSTKQIDHAQIIHKSGNDLLKLINEILDLSKIESGMIKLETDEVKLEDLSMEPMFREMAAKKKIHFKETYTPGSFDTIVTDRFRLEQILKNFIGNAMKFTEQGGEVELAIYPVTLKPKFR